MPNITEIIPDDFPDWAQKAFDDGQFFRIAVRKVEELQKKIKEHNDGCVASCEWQNKTENNCSAFISRGRLCTECPKDWLIED